MSGFSIEKKMDENDVARLMADERVREEVNCILVELARAEQLHPVWPKVDLDGVHIAGDQLLEAIFADGGSERRRRKLRTTAAMCISQLIKTEWER